MDSHRHPTSCARRGPQNPAWKNCRLEIMDKVNALALLPKGLGGLTTVLISRSRIYPTHAPALPRVHDSQLRGDPAMRISP